MKTESAEFASQILVWVSAVGIKNSGIPVISEVLPHADLFKLLCCKSFLSNIYLILVAICIIQIPKDKYSSVKPLLCKIQIV